MKQNKVVFDQVAGQPVYKLSLTNANQLTLSCLSYGAAWYELKIPTAHGAQNLLLNFGDIGAYQKTNPYLGMTIGRVAGRIGGGQFKIGANAYQVPTNEGDNTLHGGPHGFNTVNWESKISANQIIFSHRFRSQDDGFPGNLDVTVTYTLTDDNHVYIDYQALSDGLTVFNPTNHAYFNLNADDRDVRNHELYLNSPQHLALAADKIPTGKVIANAGTPYDFTKMTNLDQALAGLQDIPEKGLDDVFVLAPHQDNEPVAILRQPETQISVTMYAQRNGIVAFTANGFGPDQPYLDKTGCPYVGIALESQTVSNAIFDPDYGDLSMQAGETRHEQTHYQFDFPTPSK